MGREEGRGMGREEGSGEGSEGEFYAAQDGDAGHRAAVDYLIVGVEDVVEFDEECHRHALAVGVGSAEIQEGVVLFLIWIACLQTPYAGVFESEPEWSRVPVDLCVEFVFGCVEQGAVVSVQVSIVGIYAPGVIEAIAGLEFETLVLEFARVDVLRRPSMRCTCIISLPSMK